MDYNFTPIKLNIGTLARILQSRALFYFAISLLVFRVFLSLLAVNIPLNIFFADITKSALQSFVNQERQANKLAPLEDNHQLAVAAQLKAENMVAGSYFSHISPTGITPWYWFSKAGYEYKYAGENLAVGFYESGEVFRAWINSPTHRANVLNPNFKEIGTAVIRGFGSNNTIIVVQLFGSQKPKAAPAIAKERPSSLNFNNNEVSVETPVQIPEEAIKQAAAADKPARADGSTVLSGSIEPGKKLKAEEVGGTGYYYRVMNAILFNYDGLLQNIVFGAALIVIGMLLVLIFANFSFSEPLILRVFTIILLLLAATAATSEAIVYLIPHQVII